MRVVPAILLALAVSACASGPKKLPEPTGTTFRLNPGMWASTANPIREAAQ